MAPLARTPSLKRLAAEPKDRATPPTPTAQPSDWGHYDTGEKPPEDQNEDNEANDNDDTISWAGDGDHVTGEDFRFDSGKFGACGARCATRVYGAAPAACTAPLGFDEVDPEGRPKEACVACAADKEKKPTRSHQSGIELIVPGGEATFCLLPDRNRDGVVFEADVTWRRCRRRRAEKQLRWEEKERWEALRVRTEAPGVGAEDVAPSLCTDYRGLGVVLNPRFAPRVTSRYFAQHFPRGVTVAVALGAVRVVATPFETFAQYEVRVALDGGPARSAWRRYSAFRAFAEQLAAQCSPIDVARTLTAWGDAEAAKKVFRCVDPHYLVQRYYHFERVLREALFEVDDPQLLLAFFATHPRRTRSAEQLAAQQQRVVRPFARSRPVAVARADDDASSEQLSRTPAVRESFLTRFLGIRDSDRHAVPAH